jgi:hypothetical protein
MIYIGAFRMFWIWFFLLACAAVFCRFMKSKGATHCLVGALFGSFCGFVLAPLLGALLGSVPTLMIEPYYFTHPFYGCIAPWPSLLACVTLILGTIVGLFVGAYAGLRWRGHA